jgi:hypothetical protein
MILKEQQIKTIITQNQTAPKWVDFARGYTKELFALIDGEGFSDLLEKIEHIEGDQKSIARRKYARSIQDMFERLSRLTDNVYSSTGTTKRYDLSDSQSEELQTIISQIRGGGSLEKWLEYNWLQLYHLDPNGVIFLEYTEGLNPYPTYKSINVIQDYMPNGQKVEYLLFSPKDLEDGKKEWRLVDEVWDYCVIQEGDSIRINEERSFMHEFGCVPAVINSNLNKIGNDFIRLSPYHKIIEIAKEYGRDLSIKTIYKFLQGFPKHWRYTAPCSSCHGTGKVGEDVCKTCNGTGESHRNDVTDEIRLNLPELDEPVLAPNVAGYVAPDLATWERFNEELALLEDTMTQTHWGTVIKTEGIATATEAVLDTQPAIQRLNKYSDVAESVETMLTEMVANHTFTDKNKTESIASINYGRNFIIESLGTVLERYQASKAAGDNATILDKQYSEYLMTKYKSDPVGLSIAQLKSEVEPYLHYTSEQVQEIMGEEEAQKKVLFEDFWKTLLSYEQTAETLINQFNVWFEANKPQVEPTPETTTEEE